MPQKKDNLYQHAGIILDIMIKESGLSQTKFAKEYLGIDGGNISEARKSRKIPSRWFILVEKKLGLKEKDLCADASNYKEEYSKEHEEEDRGKRGLSLERHREIGMELYLIEQRLQHLTIEFGIAYPRFNSLAKPEEHLYQAANDISKARDRAEENLYKDFREMTSKEKMFHYYYPDGDVSREDIHTYLAKASKEITELIKLADKKRNTRNDKKGQNNTNELLEVNED